MALTAIAIKMDVGNHLDTCKYQRLVERDASIELVDDEETTVIVESSDEGRRRGRGVVVCALLVVAVAMVMLMIALGSSRIETPSLEWLQTRWPTTRRSTTPIFIRPSEATALPCARFFGDSTADHKMIKEYRDSRLHIDADPVELPMDCVSINNRAHFAPSPLSDDERHFPIAFARIVYTVRSQLCSHFDRPLAGLLIR